MRCDRHPVQTMKQLHFCTHILSADSRLASHLVSRPLLGKERTRQPCKAALKNILVSVKVAQVECWLGNPYRGYLRRVWANYSWENKQDPWGYVFCHLCSGPMTFLVDQASWEVACSWVGTMLNASLWEWVVLPALKYTVICPLLIRLSLDLTMLDNLCSVSNLSILEMITEKVVRHSVPGPGWSGLYGPFSVKFQARLQDWENIG